jgi:hypothetical protein
MLLHEGASGCTGNEVKHLDNHIISQQLINLGSVAKCLAATRVPMRAQLEASIGCKLSALQRTLTIALDASDFINRIRLGRDAFY